MFWKTRYEASIDGANTAYRTLVSYKETLKGVKSDPAVDAAGRPIWTGTWRDPRFSPPGDGGRPENGVTGTIWTVNSGTSAITVPAAMNRLRFWQNTRVATLPFGGIATLSPESLGYEWDEDLDNGARPAGLAHLSSTTVDGVEKIIDFGATTGIGTATHSLTLYRQGTALVFGAGTVQWSWGLDSIHDGGAPAAHVADQAMQQSTVNLLADMGAQPTTLQIGANPLKPLIAASASTDTFAPTSVITSPAAGAHVQSGVSATITGTATDNGGGVVASVEVSVDGGATWHIAQGAAAWSFNWSPGALGPVTIRSRAIDDSGNLEVPTGISVIVVTSCPCTSLWDTATVVPASPDASDAQPVEVGVKFSSDTAGFITSLRFYKSVNNTGTHVGNLWTSTGTLQRSAIFTNETASGWQEVDFPAPVAIAANTTYIASYHTNAGHYAADAAYFAAAGVDSAPLHAPAAGASGNGVYKYGASAFPTDTFNATNYWVDVVYGTGAPDTTPPVVSSVAPANGATAVSTGASVVATFYETMDATTITSGTFVLRNPGNVVVPSTVSYNVATSVATLTPTAALALATTYTATITGGSGGVKDIAGNAMVSSVVWSFTTGAGPTCPCTIWNASATPGQLPGDANAVELGLRFRAEATGTISGIRFYKAAANTGTHTGSLWTNGGTLLATTTFINETASGWQQVNFSSPINVTANTTYVASYHTNTGNYGFDGGVFASAGVDSAPLHALATGVDGPNSVYLYGSHAFPTQTYNAANYWVDVVYNTGADTTPPAVLSVAPANGATAVSTGAAATATFSEPMDATTITIGTFVLRSPTNVIVPSTVSYNVATGVATLTPTAELAAATTYTATITGGSGGVKDIAGNARPGGVVWSFTTPMCPCTIWNASATPGQLPSDANAVELACASAPVPRTIAGVRFYGDNKPTHIGSLWTNTGTLLATATFIDESASGWQQVNFSSPVNVTANTTYVVSYHTDTGNYAFDGGTFESAGIDNAPLHALATGVDGANSVYRYGSNAFPTETYNAANYWVDVVYHSRREPFNAETAEAAEKCLSLRAQIAFNISPQIEPFAGSSLGGLGAGGRVGWPAPADLRAYSATLAGATTGLAAAMGLANFAGSIGTFGFTSSKLNMD